MCEYLYISKALSWLTQISLDPKFASDLTLLLVALFTVAMPFGRDIVARYAEKYQSVVITKWVLGELKIKHDLWLYFILTSVALLIEITDIGKNWLVILLLIMAFVALSKFFVFSHKTFLILTQTDDELCKKLLDAEEKKGKLSKLELFDALFSINAFQVTTSALFTSTSSVLSYLISFAMKERAITMQNADQFQHFFEQVVASKKITLALEISRMLIVYVETDTTPQSDPQFSKRGGMFRVIKSMIITLANLREYNNDIFALINQLDSLYIEVLRLSPEKIDWALIIQILADVCVHALRIGNFEICDRIVFDFNRSLRRFYRGQEPQDYSKSYTFISKIQVNMVEIFRESINNKVQQPFVHQLSSQPYLLYYSNRSSVGKSHLPISYLMQTFRLFSEADRHDLFESFLTAVHGQSIQDNTEDAYQFQKEMFELMAYLLFLNKLDWLQEFWERKNPFDRYGINCNFDPLARHLGSLFLAYINGNFEQIDMLSQRGVSFYGDLLFVLLILLIVRDRVELEKWIVPRNIEDCSVMASISPQNQPEARRAIQKAYSSLDYLFMEEKFKYCLWGLKIVPQNNEINGNSKQYIEAKRLLDVILAALEQQSAEGKNDL